MEEEKVIETKETKEENKTTKPKWKPGKLTYTIIMCIVFIIITEGVIWGYGGKLLLEAILNHPQGGLVIREAVLAALVLIVMLLFNNSYVFTQKRASFFKGFRLGVFYLIAIVLFTLLYGVLEGGLFTGLPVINLLLGCFLVGVAEEFLCRGWLLNEFLERFGDNKKGVWYSIIISGLIFGLMHLGNIFTMGQSVALTIAQILGAAATGVFFGVIYYKTKNIWTVVALHGLWDFSLFLGNVAPIYQTSEYVRSVSAIGMVFAVLIAAAELINVIPYLKDIDREVKTGTIVGLAFLSMFLYFGFTVAEGLLTVEDGEVYEMDSINIDYYSVTRDNYDKYNINYTLTKEVDAPILALDENKEENVSSSEAKEGSEDDIKEPQVVELKTTEKVEYSYTLSLKEKNVLEFKNNKTDYAVEFECENLTYYIIVENPTAFVIAYVDRIESTRVTLRYIFLNKEELSDSNEYLDNIKTNMKKYILAKESYPELVALGDSMNNTTYVAAYDVDYGYIVLEEDEKMSILNRD